MTACFREPCGRTPHFETAAELGQGRRKVEGKKGQRYSNEFQRQAVERMNSCGNIVGRCHGGNCLGIR